MALAIRMRQQGRKNRQTYRIVVTNQKSPRDGAYVESLGWYNPVETEQEKQFQLDATRVAFWLSKGAIISDNVESLVKKSAPQVIKAETQRVIEKRAKVRLKKKARAAAQKA